MKPARICLTASLMLTGLAIVSVSVIFGEQRLTEEEQKAAATACSTKLTLCNAQCAAYPTVQMQTNCQAECMRNYAICMSAIARRAPKGNSDSAASPPSVAPPKPTPRKISPQKVGEVSTDRAGASATPLPGKRIDRSHPSATTRNDGQSSTSTTTTTTARKSPTPEPRQKHKQ